ncbi:MAG: hypothetical protein KBG20_03870 [Caldilineaceae bacterium]|nr:hypothetical protein [Caldilineaceae bacterium]MBP8106537.1 hypothetical protein [Caldilineaceae bacterium]MBP8121559.1 hypothetical protein [Caldilineaceae bacterium]MBP9071406.1 hypothetical protein [Caldilineaceae bacterium]
MSILCCVIPKLNEDLHTLSAVLGEWGLPAELTDWGGYVDLSRITPTRLEVRALGTELGRGVRMASGRDAALGWAMHKFTARVAAARPGSLRMVDPGKERAFLAPLPITLLPLPPDAQDTLRWLGIRTLGQFADLPAAGVWERFGKPGKLAQHWAKGDDDRPVQPSLRGLLPPVTVDVDPPTDWLPLDDLMAGLGPTLAGLADELTGIRHLRLELAFVTGDPCTVDLINVEPMDSPFQLAQRMTHKLNAQIWPGELSAITATVLDVGELCPPQLTLFPLDEKPPLPLAEMADPLTGRYGAIFHRAQISDPTHPLAAGRWRLTTP